MIISCYSYKGGVGRTQLVANIAAHLCYEKQRKVLLIDWDLEAPGLHYYFGKSNHEINKPGLLNVISKYITLRYEKSKTNKEIPVFSSENIINLVKEKNGSIDLIASGNYSDPAQYHNMILNFNWYEFYEILDGKRYIEHLKENLKNLGYDYIFVDCRTGITNYSDICNIQIPDLNIFVVAPIYQDFEGSLQMVQNIINSEYVVAGKYRKPFILPILSRVEDESPLYEQYFNEFKEKFSFTLKPLNKFLGNKFDNESFFKNTIVYYHREMAVGEKVVFSMPNPSSNELYTNYCNIAEYIEKIRNID